MPSLQSTWAPLHTLPTQVQSLGSVVEIATGLFLPTGMTFGPDGNLYVSNVGFGPPPIGLGEVLKITVPE